jgi:hypothetical protein
MRRWIGLLIFMLVFGCNRNPAPGNATTPADEAPKSVEIRLITPLLPRLQTDFSVDSKGNLYWLQESDPPAAGGDLVFLIGAGGVPQTLEELSVGNLLEKLGLRGTTGAIHSLAIGPDDALYLLFIGSRGPAPVYFVAQYVPASHGLRIVADTPRLMKESGLGPSLELARGSLLSSATDLWLWVRHTDGYALLKLESHADAEMTIHRLQPQPPGEARDWRLNDEAEHLSAGLHGMLYYVDPAHATLWGIDTNGNVSPVLSLEGLPQAVTPPAAIDGRLFMLFGDSPHFAFVSSLNPQEQELADSSKATAAFPALLAYSPVEHKSTYFYRSHLIAPESLPLQTLDPRQLTVDVANNTLLTFDAGTGELLRLRFSRQ